MRKQRVLTPSEVIRHSNRMIQQAEDGQAAMMSGAIMRPIDVTAVIDPDGHGMMLIAPLGTFTGGSGMEDAKALFWSLAAERDWIEEGDESQMAYASTFVCSMKKDPDPTKLGITALSDADIEKRSGNRVLNKLRSMAQSKAAEAVIRELSGQPVDLELTEDELEELKGEADKMADQFINERLMSACYVEIRRRDTSYPTVD